MDDVFEPPDAPVSSSDFAGGGWLAMALQAMLAINGASQLVMVLGSLGFDPESEATNPVELVFALVSVVGALGVVLTMLASVVMWCFWTYRMASNLRVFGREPLEYTAGSTVWWWFVPFANLIQPYRATVEIWKASALEDDDGDWQYLAVPGLFTAWWGCWVVSNLLSNVSLRMEMRMGPSDVTAMLDVVNMPIELASTITALLVVRGITERQDALALKMGL